MGAVTAWGCVADLTVCEFALSPEEFTAVGV
jgi:hypothetical protein